MILFNDAPVHIPHSVKGSGVPSQQAYLKEITGEGKELIPLLTLTSPRSEKYRSGPIG